MTTNWLALAHAKRDDYIGHLKQLLSINSIEDMTTATEGKPFGEGVAAALDFMLALGDQNGFRTKNLEGYAGYIEFGDADEEIGVLAHVDVVPVGDGWTTPPFAPDIRDGRIYARGAIDDKGPALAAFYAMQIVRDHNLPLSKRVRFIIGTDEESGWLCMKRYGELERFPEIGFSPDADFPIIHAEKGQINPVLKIADTHPDLLAAGSFRLLSFQSGDRVNMVPDGAKAVVEGETVQELEAPFTAFLEKEGVPGTIAINGITATLTLDGRAAHGMEPYEGLNAGTLLAGFLNGFAFSGKGKAFLSLLADVLHNDHYGERFGVACEDDVTGKLTVNTGAMHYDETDGESVRLNIRYPATIDKDERVDVLRSQAANRGWHIDSVRTSKSHHVPKDHPMVQTLQRVYHEQTGQEPTLLTSGGATYARSLKHGVAFGAAFPGTEMTAHQKDEYAILDDLVRAISLYAQAIYELAK